jgi:hypothetical protein
VKRLKPSHLPVVISGTAPEGSETGRLRVGVMRWEQRTTPQNLQGRWFGNKKKA